MPVEVTYHCYVRVKVHGKFSTPVVPRIGVTQVGWSAAPMSHSSATLHLDGLLHFGKVQVPHWSASFVVKMLQVGLLKIINLRYVEIVFSLHDTVRNREASGWQSSTSKGRNQVALVKNEGAQAEAESLTWNMILKCIRVSKIQRKWYFALSIQVVSSLF